MVSYLDKTGLAYFWEKIKAWIPFLSRKTQSIPFGQVDSTSTSTVFTATVDGITELRDGVCCYIRNDEVNSAANFTLNVNGLGAKPVYSNMEDAGRLSTGWSAAKTYLFIYNSTRISGGCWDAYYGNYVNDDYRAYVVRTGNSTLPAKFKTYRYRLLFTSADGNYYVGANASTSTNATAVRTPTTEKIDPFGRIVYYGTTSAVNENANFSTGSLYQQSGLTLGYSFNNTGVALVLDFPKPVYIKCAPQTDGSAIIDATTPYVQSLPTTEDGKIYIFLGIAYSDTAIELTLEHPIYYFKGGQIRKWTNASEIDISGKADKVSVATNGNFAGLDSSGNLTDSGYAPSDFALASGLPTYTIVKLGTAETDYIASYVLQKDGTQEGATINIPKDYLVKSGSVIDVVEYNGQYYDATDTSHTTPLPVSAAGKYLDFVVNTVDSSGTSSHIYIAVNDLVDAYTEGNGIDISNLNVVSIQIDSSNSNGLSVSSNGLALATAVASSGGVGGSNGAMTAADKEKLNGLRKMAIMEYGLSTWNDLQSALSDNAVVYCKASSNANPAVGEKRRMAFLAYLGTNNVEFQYYRSVSSHSATQQGDQVYVYTLTNNSIWSVTVRESYTKIVAGTNLTSSYSNGALNINADAISTKADKVSGATNGNLAGLDSNGNLTDSGSKASDFATAAQGALADTALQSYTETDPTVPSWAKQSSKPTYTASEVGALPDTTIIPTITFRQW